MNEIRYFFLRNNWTKQFFSTSFYPQESVRFPNHFLTPALNWWSPTSHYDSIATSWTFRVRLVSLQAPYTWQHHEKSNSRTSLLLHHSSIPYSHSLTFFEPTFFLWYAETIIPRRSIIFLKHFTISFHSYFFWTNPGSCFTSWTTPCGERSRMCAFSGIPRFSSFLW